MNGSKSPNDTSQTFTVPPQYPALRNGRIQLVAGDAVKRDALHSLIRQSSQNFEWRGLGSGVSAAAIDRALSDRVLCQFVVIASADREMVGLVQFVAADYVHGTVGITLLFHPEYRSRGWPIEASVLAANYVFVAYPLRKLVAEVPELNDSTFGAGLGRLMRRDAVLPSHEWHVGDYRSVALYSIDRNQFNESEIMQSIVGNASDGS